MTASPARPANNSVANKSAAKASAAKAAAAAADRGRWRGATPELIIAAILVAAAAVAGARAIFGYGQRRFIVATSLTSRPLYESDLRPVLEHILAARLADGHGVNLYTEPEAARRTFCRTRADESLWPWIDPGQITNADERSRLRGGIPRQTLGRLITRLEQL
jgi:hypothetical protein